MQATPAEAAHSTDRSIIQLLRLQDRQTLLHRLLRFDAQNGIVVVGNRVRNHHKRIPRHTRDLRHRLSRLNKPVGNDRRGRNPRFFR